MAGTKLNGNGTKWFYTLLCIGIALGTIILGIGKTHWTAEANKKEIDCVKEKIEINTTFIARVDERLIAQSAILERIDKKT